MKFLYKIPGPILVTMGAFFLSYGGLLVKSFEGSDLWQILLYRSIFCFFTVGVFLFFTYKKETFNKFKVSGFPGFLAGFFISLGFTAYVFAMYNTTVANVNFTITTQTIFLAIFGYIFLREKISVYTLISIIFAMSGVLLMLGNSLSTGGLLGNVVALTMPIAFAVLIIIVRKYPYVDMVPAMFVAAFLSAIYASFLVNSFYISPKDLFLSFLLGTFQIGFGFICITIGSKNTPAAIVGILMLVEAILGPVWAWIFINESPPLIVIIGGGIIMFSILFQFIFTRKTA